MSIKDLIEKRNKELEELKVKDHLEAMKFYAENCVVMPSTGETIIGRNDFTKYFEANFSRGTYGVETKTEEVIGDENSLVVARGSYKFNEGNKELNHGTFVTVWKKMNNEYQIQYDIWTEAKSQ